MWSHHESEHKEHGQLCEPSESVEERLGLMFARELAIADDQSSDIDSEVGVTLHEVRHAEDKDTCREHHDRIQ